VGLLHSYQKRFRNQKLMVLVPSGPVIRGCNRMTGSGK
jgi:hypothetical protein